MAICQSKYKYSTRELALTVAESFERRNRGQRRYAYECPCCGCWHLSSSPTRIVRR
jgi:hypothetical protein